MQSEPKVRIDVFSHGIRVYGFGHEVKQRLYYYIDNRLSQYDTVPNGHGGWRKERIRSYCSANRDRTEFRFHRNCLDEILMELSQIRLNVTDGSIVVNEIPMYEPVQVDLKSSDPRPFRDYQIPQFEYLTAEGRNKMCNLPAGTGKAGSYDTLIKSPIKDIRLEDIRVGDQVYAWNGDITTVTGVYPKEKHVFRKFKLSDGRFTWVGDEHLWKARVSNNHWRATGVYCTEELVRNLNNGCKVEIPSSLIDPNRHSEWLTVSSITGRRECAGACIEIDHPSRLYLMNDYLVTHNTTVALRASDRIGHRLAIVIRPMYIQRWLDDLEAYHSLDRKDIMVVNGSKELMGLMCLAQEGKLDAKVIIISNKTLQRYLKSYASMEDFIYPYRPEEFYQALGVGVRLIDEVHQDFHLNFLQDCYSHVPKTISLSGTMESDNRFDNEMYRLMFPMAERGPVYHQPPYIQLVNLWYNFSSQTQRLIRFTGHRRQYSHTALEKSLRRHKWLQAKYIGMIVELVGDIFVTDHEHGQKCAIYCATVDLCAKVRDALRAMYPQFKIDKYTQEEPYEVLLGCDIAVTTLQSAGTAVDIPNLKVILSTVALSSKQANEQLIKRLRPLKDWPEVTPTFYFLSALCIPKHLEYANGKRGKLNGKVLGIKEERTEWNL